MACTRDYNVNSLAEQSNGALGALSKEHLTECGELGYQGCVGQSVPFTVHMIKFSATCARYTRPSTSHTGHSFGYKAVKLTSHMYHPSLQTRATVTNTAPNLNRLTSITTTYTLILQQTINPQQCASPYSSLSQHSCHSQPRGNGPGKTMNPKNVLKLTPSAAWISNAALENVRSSPTALGYVTAMVQSGQ